MYRDQAQYTNEGTIKYFNNIEFMIRNSMRLALIHLQTSSHLAPKSYPYLMYRTVAMYMYVISLSLGTFFPVPIHS
jgi:hypothetical protein